MAISKALRLTVRTAGVVLVVVLAGFLALRIYGNRRLAAAEREFTAKVGPMAGNPYASAKVPDDENAAILLRAGAEAVVLPGGDKPLAGDLTMIEAKRWNAQQVTEIRRILAANAPALELLHRAAPMTRSSFGLVDSVNEAEELDMTSTRLGLAGPVKETEKFKAKMPILKLLWGQRLLLLDARLALHNGDWQRFLTDAVSMSTMAVALERESPLVAVLIGIAAEKILLTVTSEATARPDVSLETLRSLQSLLPETDLRATWRRALLVSAVGTDRRVAAVRADPKRMGEEGFGVKGRLLELLFGGIFAAQQRELYSDLVGVVDQPLGSNPRWADRGKARPKSMFSVFESVMFPELAGSGGRVQSTMSLRNLADVALKVRIEGLRTGAYPPTLAAYPEAMRPDPFAAKPLSYVLRPDGSAVIAVRDFVVLWKRVSVGPVAQPFSWELPAPGTAVATK
ncbi:MAG: hypothetical protein EPN53_09005 [Acidobacteria bacterium]|nr:MAG: hypothetical protein EPN53_09005 [Acidobacteriota bacterium]